MPVTANAHKGLGYLSDSLLAGDIGGTKTALAIFSSDNGQHRPLAQANFSSGDYDSLESIVAQFLTVSVQDIVDRFQSQSTENPCFSRRFWVLFTMS